MYKKKKKTVIFLRTMHNDSATDTTGKLKPEIINNCNSTKGGVNTMKIMMSN
jgi:hypothetical protein